MAPPTIDQAKAYARAGRDREAVEIIRQLAAADDPEGLYLLGEMTWRGGLVQQDSHRGRALYERAGTRGHPIAQTYATNLLASGIAGPRDWPAALRQLKREAARDSKRRKLFDLVRTMDLDPNGDPRRIPPSETLAERPNVRIVRQLATAAECAHIIAVAEPSYGPSLVYNEQEQWVQDSIRTSDGSPIHWLLEDPVIHAMNRRIAAATGTPYENGETLQSLRYRPGQEYRPHFDFVPGDNPRLTTALFYLNEDYEGGETAFVNTGLKVKGRTGDLLVFENALPSGEEDPLAEHAGLPVTSGVKYLATRWIRGRRWTP